MQTDIDVQRYTDALVKKLGRRAPAHAAVRAEMMLEAGELNLYETWKEIIQSVNDRRFGPFSPSRSRVGQDRVASRGLCIGSKRFATSDSSTA